MENKVTKPTEKHFYDDEIEKTMQRFFYSLNEKERRRYAGLEALKIGHGGQDYIAEILGCSRRTVNRGAREVIDLPKKK
ncbi:MAG: hypothetical protein U9N19_01015 [Thermodesulfobacteriota bacterium]|nr:hypothetical protein [Thermodesulfobacteriota bacterium]